MSVLADEVYRNTDLSPARRAAGLVARMDLEEKVSQMVHDAGEVERLGIPPYNWWNECLHGVARAGLATVFPQAIGLAATFDLGLMRRVATAISDEARAKHHAFARQGQRGMGAGLTVWSPNVNIFRDPRWGRGQETYGEDPYLAARMGVEFVRGLQGDDPRLLKLVATPKHFAVHSGPEGERHRFDAVVSERDLRETYLPAFEACVREGGAASIMAAYNRTNGEACCASRTLLQDILRGEWGFAGYVVSDCWAISDIYRYHGLAPTVEQAAALAVRNGCDLNCGEAYLALLSAVDAGFIAEAEIDMAVTRLMTARFRLGMFDPEQANPYAQTPLSVVGSPEHTALALEAATRSIVLLKNDPLPQAGPLLPLQPDRLRSVALLGPAIDDEEVLLGNYHGTAARPVTVLAGLRARLGDGVELRHGPGCALAEGWPNLRPVPASALSPQSLGAPEGGEQGLLAAYYGNATFYGAPAFERVDPEVNFVWRESRPLPYLGHRPFSVRWTGRLAPEVTGQHRLAFRCAGRFSVYLDGRPIMRGENLFEPVTVVHDVDLEQGLTYGLRMEYTSLPQQPHAQFLWATPGQAQVEREEALASAAAADVVIACLGLSPELEGEEMPVSAAGFDRGDRTEIALPRPQQEFLELLYGLGKPLVLVILSGSAVSIPWAAERIPAILQAWYPGEQGGAALAGVLFGDANPAGRLPVTVYRSLDDLPPFEDYAMDAAPLARTYRFFRGQPLYPFGHGLSYTRFAYNRLRVEPAALAAGEEARVVFELANVGEMAGDEVPQLYVRYGMEGRPLQELKGFERIHLRPGETREVSFTLPATRLHFWDGGWQPCAGEVQLAVGPSSADIRLTTPLTLEGNR